MQYIQNRTNWCWAVACKMVGEQFKRNHPELDFCIPSCREGNEEADIEAVHEKGVRTNDRNGLRMDVVKWDGESFCVDPWQRAIVMNANTESPGTDGNWPGDDEAKEKGIKYVITGKCDSPLVKVVSIGNFNYDKSILYYHYMRMRTAFAQNKYLIGNAILYPNRVCHSFVLLDWTAEDQILLYDPWDGCFGSHTATEVFCNGISVPLGRGIVKWAQYVQ